MVDRPAPPMARNFVHGLGYTVHRDILLAEECKTTWEKVEKNFGGGEPSSSTFGPGVQCETGGGSEEGRHPPPAAPVQALQTRGIGKCPY